MESITKTLYSLLLTAEAPMTLPELQSHFQTTSRGTIAALLNQRTHNGFLTRSGTWGHFTYALSDGLRERLKTERLDDIVKQRNVTLGRMRPAKAAQEPAEAARPATAQPTVLWPATADDRPLSPTLGTPLPWANEEDVPPWLGERYRDALRPRPVDD